MPADGLAFFISAITLILFFFPCQTSIVVRGNFFSTILIVSNFVKPHVSSFKDCFDLSFFVLKPLATAINLLFFFLIDDAKEYFSYERKPVLIPSAPMFLYKSGFRLPWVIGSPPVLSHVNYNSAKYS